MDTIQEPVSIDYSKMDTFYADQYGMRPWLSDTKLWIVTTFFVWKLAVFWFVTSRQVPIEKEKTTTNVVEFDRRSSPRKRRSTALYQSSPHLKVA